MKRDAADSQHGIYLALQQVIPPYDALVLASGRLARERPDVVRALAASEGTVSAEAMRATHAAVDRGELDPAQAGAGLLC